MIAIEDIEFAFASSAGDVSSPSISPAGADRLLLAFGGNFGSPVDAYVDMTYGGGAMTPFDNRAPNFFFRQVTEYLVAPSTGGGVVTYTVSFDSTVGVVALALSGVDQTTPVENAVVNSAGSGSPTLDVTITSATGDLAIAFFWGDAAEIAASGGATTQLDEEGANSICMGVFTKAGAASVNLAAAVTSIVNGMGAVGMNIKAAAGGGGGGISIPVVQGYRRMMEMR